MRRARGWLTQAVLLIVAAAGPVGCVGSIPNSGQTGAPGTGGQTVASGAGDKKPPNGDPNPGPGDPSPGNPASAPRCLPGPIKPGPAHIHRLNRTEYNNTVRDLLGDTTSPASDFGPEEKDRALGFDNNAQALTVSSVLAEQYLNAAEQVAARAIARKGLLACDPATAGESCARTFLGALGQRAWRRPLDSAELDEVMASYRGSTSGGMDGIRLAIIYLLQAPEFFYRIELGSSASLTPGVVKLGPWEVASRLSYQLWNSMPDDALFAAAQAGQLGTKDQIAAQARRMLADPRAAAAVANFHDQWLQLQSLSGLAKDQKLFPTYSPELGDMFRQETETFAAKTLWEGGNPLPTLLTAPYSFVNARLAKFYGVNGPTGTAFEQVAMKPAQRAGVLTQGSFLAQQAKVDQTSPVKRGKFVREQILCTPPPPPPPDVKAMAPDLDPNPSTRERFAMHEVPGCKECHSLMDPIGLGFETYDGAGVWRSTEKGKTIDSTGEIVGTDVAGTFANALELERKLAASGDVARCMATQWLRFAYGRNEAAEDTCVLWHLGETVRGGGNLKDLVLALTQTDAFLYRNAVVPGGAP